MFKSIWIIFWIYFIFCSLIFKYNVYKVVLKYSTIYLILKIDEAMEVDISTFSKKPIVLNILNIKNNLINMSLKIIMDGYKFYFIKHFYF